MRLIKGLIRGLHPALMLSQISYAAVSYLWWSDHLRSGATFTAATVLWLLVKNVLSFSIYYGVMYWIFYIAKVSKQKIDPKPPRIVNAETKRSVISWLVATAYEVLIALAVSRGWVTFTDSWSIPLTLAVLVWADLHFFVTHRLLHVKPLYKRVHYVHHLSSNPNPFSSFSFHPIEAVVYFSAMLLVFVAPLGVVHVVILKTAIDLTPVYGHLGYGAPGDGSWFHYLHHRHHNCHYGASVFWDYLLGTTHDSAFPHPGRAADRDRRERQEQAAKPVG